MLRLLSVGVLLLTLGFSLESVADANGGGEQHKNKRLPPTLATITIDEDGIGSLQTSSVVALPHAQLLDPLPGGRPGALTYALAPAPGPGSFLVNGDLILLDPTGGVSDVLRFNNVQPAPGGGTGVVVFYSRAGGGRLADIGLPSSLQANTFSILEVEGGQTVYTPTATQPGFVAGFSVTYRITSNLVPTE